MKQQTSKEKVKAIQWFLVGLIMASIISLIFLKPPYAHAMEFPSDAQVLHAETITSGNFSILATSTARTILNVNLNGDGSNSQMGVWCAGLTGHIDTVNDILETHASPAVEDVKTEYHCNGQPVTGSATSLGAKGGHVYLVWVDRDTRTTRDPMELGQSTATSTYVAGNFMLATTTSPAISNGFTYGEVLQILFLILIFTLIFFKTIKEWVIGTKVENPPKNARMKFTDIK